MSTTILNNSDYITPTGNIHVKLQFNDEFRRFFIPQTNPSIKFEDLESKIKTLLRITENDIVIKYKDEENEWITISTDAELETGLMIAGNGQIFRLLCITKDLQNNTTTTTGECGETVPHWKKYKQDRNRENYPKKDKKWKKNYQRKGGKSDESETEKNLTPEPLHEDNANEENETKRGERRQKKEKRGKKDRKGDGGGERRKNYRNDDGDDSNGSSSESNSDIALMTLDEIKVEVSKLKEEENILKEKVRGVKESWKVAKDAVKAKRKEENVQTDVILAMREDLMIKEKEKKRVQTQLRFTRCRMNKLREAAQTKQV